MNEQRVNNEIKTRSNLLEVLLLIGFDIDCDS